ncbi:MAG: PIG-L family deacetylase [Chloroflexota bacterium]
MSETSQRVLMAVFAHPDDEAFGSGGTLSKYAASGCDVYLVTATRGEAGGISGPGLATAANLPDVRERELRCAAASSGIHPPILLDYMDGQLTIVHQGQAVGKLVRLIRRLRPHVLITFGPDGIYGHYDHIAVHRWATIAVALAADPACFPDLDGGACQPHAVSKVYHRAMTADRLASMGQDGRPATVMMDGVPFPFVARRDDELTTVIDVGAHVGQKLRGILCHRTQLQPNNPYATAPDELMAADWFRQEHFVLAHSTVGWPAQGEDDLFAGL